MEVCNTLLAQRKQFCHSSFGTWHSLGIGSAHPWLVHSAKRTACASAMRSTNRCVLATSIEVAYNNNNTVCFSASLTTDT